VEDKLFLELLKFEDLIFQKNLGNQAYIDEIQYYIERL
jgi:hypothetical protein